MKIDIAELARGIISQCGSHEPQRELDIVSGILITLVRATLTEQAIALDVSRATLLDEVAATAGIPSEAEEGTAP